MLSVLAKYFVTALLSLLIMVAAPLVKTEPMWVQPAGSRPSQQCPDLSVRCCRSLDLQQCNLSLATA